MSVNTARPSSARFTPNDYMRESEATTSGSMENNEEVPEQRASSPELLSSGTTPGASPVAGNLKPRGPTSGDYVPSKLGSKRGLGGWTKADDETLLHLATQRQQCVPSNNDYRQTWSKIAQTLGKNFTADQCYERWCKVLNPSLNKGPWTPEEDQLIQQGYEMYGSLAQEKWSKIADHVKTRNGKQVRERWINHLDPAISHEPWTKEEEVEIVRQVLLWKRTWTDMIVALPTPDGKHRPANAIKNRYNTAIKPIIDGTTILAEALAKLDVVRVVRSNDSSTRKRQKMSSSSSDQFLENIDGDSPGASASTGLPMLISSTGLPMLISGSSLESACDDEEIPHLQGHPVADSFVNDAGHVEEASSTNEKSDNIRNECAGTGVGTNPGTDVDRDVVPGPENGPTSSIDEHLFPEPTYHSSSSLQPSARATADVADVNERSASESRLNALVEHFGLEDKWLLIAAFSEGERSSSECQEQWERCRQQSASTQKQPFFPANNIASARSSSSLSGVGPNGLKLSGVESEVVEFMSFLSALRRI